MFKRSNKATYFLSSKVEIRETESKGLGIFAKDKIFKRELIESSPAILFNTAILNEWNESVGGQHILSDYVFLWQNNQFAVGLGYTSLYNHSNNSNATWRPSWLIEKTHGHQDSKVPKIQIIALNDISPEEEICIHYSRSMGDLSFTENGTVMDEGHATKEVIGKIKRLYQGNIR